MADGEAEAYFAVVVVAPVAVGIEEDVLGGGEHGGPQPEQHVGADFPPISDEDASAVSPPFDEPATERPIIDRPYNHPPVSPPEPQPAAPPQAAAPAQAQPEPPRRRSTIREPAPIGIAGAPPPAPPTP